MNPSIAIVGGGSYQRAPTILTDIAVTPELRGARVVLQDVDPTRLRTVKRWAEVMLGQTGAELTVEATLAGDRRLALQALLGDPLVRDFATAPKMLDDLLTAHRALLPRFA